jgi:ribulose 1,5-bisphosphate synthetase/thiazole synthase
LCPEYTPRSFFICITLCFEDKPRVPGLISKARAAKLFVSIMAARRVAVIGLGPSGAITIDALAQEKAFDTIRVFERRDAPGGCWYVV